jgi:restriction system protein
MLMNGREIERLIADAFRRRGFTVTGFSGGGVDGCHDLGLARDGMRYLVQCKHWRKDQVGITAVRDLCAILAAQRVHGGFLVSGGHFTPEARDFAKSGAVQLIDGVQLAALIAKIARLPRKKPSRAATSPLALTADCR